MSGMQHDPNTIRELVERAKRLSDAATGGWFVARFGSVHSVERFLPEDAGDPNAMAVSVLEDGSAHDAEFIAAARTLVPELADALLVERQAREEAERRAEVAETALSVVERTPDALTLTARVTAAEARVAALEAALREGIVALRKWGYHRLDCSGYHSGEGDCACGWDDYSALLFAGGSDES